LYSKWARSAAWKSIILIFILSVSKYWSISSLCGMFKSATPEHSMIAKSSSAQQFPSKPGKSPNIWMYFRTSLLSIVKPHIYEWGFIH
jgi:hypothetical protein